MKKQNKKRKSSSSKTVPKKLAVKKIATKKKTKAVKSTKKSSKVEKVLDPFESNLREKTLINEKKDISKINTVDEFFAPLKTDTKNADVKAINKIKENLKYKTQLKDINAEPEAEQATSQNLSGFLVLPFKKISDAIYNSLRIFWIKQKIKRKHDLDEHFLDTDDVFAPHVTFFGLMLPYGWQKALVTFLVISFLLVAPIVSMLYLGSLFQLKDRVLALSNEAYQHLQLGQGKFSELDLSGATQEFQSATQKFLQARQEIDDLNFLTLAVIKTMPEKKQTLDMGLSLLDIGGSLSNAGYYLLDGINSLFSDRNLDLNQKFSILNHDLSLALVDIAKAQDDIENIDFSSLQNQNMQVVDLASAELLGVEQKLKEFSLMSEAILNFLGQDQWKRYLLIFQNNNEIRATGGFMGSYALLDVDRGKIKNLEVPAGGTYDLQGSLKVAVASPMPLRIINPRWEFQDANWWPDFPTTARKLIWFHENADGPTVDGVIAVTSSVMEDLLKVTGPIRMPEYDRMITYENFEEETQKIVELEYDPQINRPKQFIADLAPKILDALGKMNQKDFPKLIEIIYENLQAKNIQFYFANQNLQDLALAFNWAGEMQQSDSDYLAVISSNIAGAKTDSVIETDISHRVDIQSDGSIIDTVIITKRHLGQKPNIFFGVQNNDYLRVYVPAGSKLIEANGFLQIDEELFESAEEYIADVHIATVETNLSIDPTSDTRIYNENGKSVFANWFLINPGEEKSVYFKYQLPHTIDGGYSLLVQKQAGKDDIIFSSDIKADINLAIQNIYPQDIERRGNNLRYSNILNKDLFYGFTIAE